MKRFLASFVLLATVGAAPVLAQPGAGGSLDQFLEQRVAEELASDGTPLSRAGVALDVEIVGQHVLVSLVDPATRRVVASTKVSSLPGDREAAVASLVQVASNLLTQIGKIAPSATAAPAPMLAELHSAQTARADAESLYRQEAISFGEDIVISGNRYGVSTSRHWVAYQGEPAVRLDAEQFYRTVERPDLLERYQSRRRWAIGTIVGGSAASVVGLVWMLGSVGGSTSADGSYESPSLAGPLTLTIAGATVATIGAVLAMRMHPVSESEAIQLGVQHNKSLRAKYGLPVAGTPGASANVRDVAVSPYAGAGGGGLAVSGRF